MSQTEHFDTVILGSGEGGKLLAWHLGRSGQRVAVVERQWVGGSCPAVACLPSKNEIWSARVAHLAQHAADFGTITGPVTVDMAKVRERKRGMIEREVCVSPAGVCGERRGADHGQRTFHCAENSRGATEQWRNAHAERRPDCRQCRIACGYSGRSGSECGATAHAYRRTGPRLHAGII